MMGMCDKNWHWYFNQNYEKKTPLNPLTFYEEDGYAFCDADVVMMPEDRSCLVCWFDQVPDPEEAVLIASAPQLKRENALLKDVLRIALTYAEEEKRYLLANDVCDFDNIDYEIVCKCISDAKKILGGK